MAHWSWRCFHFSSTQSIARRNVDTEQTLAVQMIATIYDPPSRPWDTWTDAQVVFFNAASNDVETIF